LALLGRECGWKRADLAEFTPMQLHDIAKETLHQKQQDWWEDSYPVAQLSALTANLHRKKGSKAFKIEQFIGKRPKRREKKEVKNDDLASLVQAAKAKGLKVPGKLKHL